MYFQTKKIKQTNNRNRPGENWIANEVLLSKIDLMISELNLDSLSILQ